MKRELQIATKDILGTQTADEWMDRLLAFLNELSKLLKEKVAEEDLIDYGERLVIARAQLARYTYIVRRERDKAVATGYEKYPKGEYNSDAATALTRQFASPEIRLRELLSEMEKALDMRFELNRSAISTARVALQRG